MSFEMDNLMHQISPKKNHAKKRILVEEFDSVIP
jgi:hypothetical protein